MRHHLQGACHGVWIGYAWLRVFGGYHAWGGLKGNQMEKILWGSPILTHRTTLKHWTDAAHLVSSLTEGFSSRVGIAGPASRARAFQAGKQSVRLLLGIWFGMLLALLKKASNGAGLHVRTGTW